MNEKLYRLLTIVRMHASEMERSGIELLRLHCAYRDCDSREADGDRKKKAAFCMPGVVSVGFPGKIRTRK